MSLDEKPESFFDECESETDSLDLFPNRRLSEVVAQMLDSDTDYEEPNQEVADDADEIFAEPYDIQTALINYLEEPRNMDLFREPLPSIEESDLEYADEDADECENEVGNREDISDTVHKSNLETVNDIKDDNANFQEANDPGVFAVNCDSENDADSVSDTLSNISSIRSVDITAKEAGHRHHLTIGTTVDDFEESVNPDNTLSPEVVVTRTRWSVTSV